METRLNRRNKLSHKVILYLLVVSSLFTSVGYAYLKTSLIATGDVVFDERILYSVCNEKTGFCHVDSNKNNQIDVGEEVYRGSEFFFYIGSDGDNLKLFSRYNLQTATQNGQKVVITKQGVKASNGTTYGIEYGSKFSNQRSWWKCDKFETIDSRQVCRDSNGNMANLNNQANSDSIAYNAAVAYGNELGRELSNTNIKGRLITYEEAYALLDKFSDMIFGHYEEGEYLHYWFGTAYTAEFVWHVAGNLNGFTWNYPDYGTNVGVRPVITVPKSLVK